MDFKVAGCQTLKMIRPLGVIEPRPNALAHTLGGMAEAAEEERFHCNFKTSYDYFQYAEAEGLRILAFPCNQFGSQEPGTSAEIKAFAENKGIEWGKGFDLYSKIDVNGKNAHPIWEYLKSKQGGLLGKGIKWNFTKFVVNKEGEPVKRFGPMDDPIPKVEAAIKELF